MKTNKIPEFEYLQKGTALICNAKDLQKSFSMFISPILVLREQYKDKLVFENLETGERIITKPPHLARK